MLRDKLSFSVMTVTEWKKINIDGSCRRELSDSEDLVLVELKSLCDAHEAVVEEEKRLTWRV